MLFPRGILAKLAKMPLSLEKLESQLLVGSTLVEGSTLSEEEAGEVLRGRTVAGHPVREIRELLQYRGAVTWFLDEVADVPFLSIDLVQGFHARLFAEDPAAGRWKQHRNFTFLTSGDRLDYLAPAKVGAEMQVWVEQANQSSGDAPGVAAARLYHRFEMIHPFDDGNGRIGRLLVAYWADWKHQLAFSFYLSDKIAHLEALEAAASGDFEPLTQFFSRRFNRS